MTGGLWGAQVRMGDVALQIIQVERQSARHIERFGSRFAILPILRSVEGVQASFAYLEADGLIGRHQALTNQLFAVVAGDGWVSGEDEVKHAISAGQMVFWAIGEWHETGSAGGLTALIIEGASILPM